MLVPTITRDDLARIYGVSQGYLGYLLRENKVPLPIQVGEEQLWFSDEVHSSLPVVRKFVDKYKKVN